ncbi:Rft protein-domain-containing protein [Umbelopsis sp. PMI_123]|nr:Rft protein-domain-containing protein [Umbelopsis sp. PMI_123]
MTTEKTSLGADDSKNVNNVLSSSVAGASYLILLQLASRMLTFALHQIVVRYSSAETLGIASVKLELLLSTILFLSREGFRYAVLVSSAEGQVQKITNLAYVPMMIGLVTTLLACVYYLSTIDDETALKYPFYRTSIVLFGLSAYCELIMEPLYIMALNNLYFNTTTYWFDRELLNLSVTLTKQSLLKHVLTEGDKMLVSALSSDKDQGVYALVVNYATLIDLLVGSAWSRSTNAPTVLSFYCAYVPVMGINGISEAFVQAVASEQQLARLSKFMIVFSLIFMSSGVLFMHFMQLGAIGLILANIVNLGSRIIYSWIFIRKYFLHNRGQDIAMLSQMITFRNWFPSKVVLFAFATGWGITRLSEEIIGWTTLREKIIHIAVGGVAALFALASM